MPQSETDGHRLSRRQYAQILAGASAASVAGCLGDGDDDDDGDGDGDDADTDDEDDPGTEGEMQREAIRVHVDNLPGQANFNEWAASPQGNGHLYLSEMGVVQDLLQPEYRTDGHEFDQTWHPNYDDQDGFEVPTFITDYWAESNTEVQYTFRGYDGQEPLTYWDGTEIDAWSWYNMERMWWHEGGGMFDDDDDFQYEVVDDYHARTWTDDALQERILLDEEAPDDSMQPMHPEFLNPYVERFDDAGTEDEQGDIEEELAGERVGFEQYAENGWGSSLYELDPDDLGAEQATLRMREDHPNDHATIPELQFRFAETDRLSLLLDQGEIDIFGGVVQEDEGTLARNQLPDHFQETQRYLQPGGTDVLRMNWHNPHLENLWVRRAVVAAIDWFAVGANGWGPERSLPVEDHVFMGQLAAEANFDDEFLDELYQYPMESDFDLAEEWMENAGYTRDGDEWVGPDGDTMNFDIVNVTWLEDWVAAKQTIEAQLSDFGIPTEFQSFEEAAWIDRTGDDGSQEPEVAMAFLWGPGEDPWQYYDSIGEWWAHPLVGSDPEMGNNFQVDSDEYGERDNWGRPFEQQIPTDVGSIEAPDEAGVQPDLEAAGIDAETVSLPELVRRDIRSADTTDEEYQETLRKCARYYNYYLPSFLFHNYTWGVAGNIRDFNFPPQGERANYIWKEFSSEEYLTVSGTVHTKYDDDYPEP